MATEEGKRIGLSLSGGGYRATLFNLGALWRLNELGILSRLDVISSVSGGSIVSAHLALRWRYLEYDLSGVATNFIEQIVRPIEQFCSQTSDVRVFLRGLISPTDSFAATLARRYNRLLYEGRMLSDLPDHRGGEGPKFVILSTNYLTGAAFRFMYNELADYRLGTYENPKISIATAVAASSAFPPLFAPLTLKLDADRWRDKPRGEGMAAKRWSRPRLADGGVYDNLGLQAIREHADIVMVSDAGKPFKQEKSQKRNWLSQLGRVRDIGMNQALARRKNELIAAFVRKEIQGTYWGITTDIDHYEVVPSFFTMNDRARFQSSVRTRLNTFGASEQGSLINWGYSVCDAAVRTHVSQIIHCHTQPSWPLPEWRL